MLLLSVVKFSAPQVIFGAVAITVGFFLYKNRRDQLRANPRSLPYPPGPPPRPVIGNLFDLARENEVQAYLELSKKYGDLVFLRVIGKNILLVNSFQVANDLFEKRSATYSSRNHSPMIHNLMGWDWTIGLMPYGERWRAHRRMFHRQFQQSVAPVHWPTQRKEAHGLLRRLFESPNDMREHLRHNAASVIMNVTYGISIAPQNDRYVTIAEKALAGMSEAANPGAFLVDLLPLLKYVPEWMPGAGFKRKAREWKEALYEMRDAPYEVVRRALEEGTAHPSFISNIASELESRPRLEFEKEMEIVKAVAGMSYAAGTEGVMSALSSFFLAMIMFPEVQAKAQDELDCVIGHGRLPDFSDRKSLPYINAIVKEILRWSPVAPFGLPHMTTDDDEYDGYFIPAGTIVIGNSWAILHDPERYPNPDVFNPDRFLTSLDPRKILPIDFNSFPSSDPLTVTFGYGRRVCPGMYMADAQIWLSVACILAVFDTGPGEIDAMGKSVKPEGKFTSGFIRCPQPYKYSIKPRREYTKVLVEQTGET